MERHAPTVCPLAHCLDTGALQLLQDVPDTGAHAMPDTGALQLLPIVWTPEPTPCQTPEPLPSKPLAFVESCHENGINRQRKDVFNRPGA